MALDLVNPFEQYQDNELFSETHFCTYSLFFNICPCFIYTVDFLLASVLWLDLTLVRSGSASKLPL